MKWENFILRETRQRVAVNMDYVKYFIEIEAGVLLLKLTKNKGETDELTVTVPPKKKVRK